DDCTDPGAAPTNGQKNGDDYSHGQTVTYTCDTGYTLSGDGTLTCNLGVWDNTVPTCLPDDCTDPGAAPTNGQKNGDDYSHGQTVTYTCDTGYTLSGDATLTCDLGNWDYAVPTCLPDDCTDPGAAPTNGQKSGDDYSHGQTVTYTCDTGYTLSGDATLTCELGDWDNAVPTCLPDDCTDPGAAPTNGQKNGDDYSHGQTVTYTCDTGYTLSGDATLTCDLGNWDYAVPTCLPDDCTDPGAAPTNGQKNGDDYSHGQTVTYTCDTGYTLSGDATLTCDLGNWDYAVPTCLPDDCTDPGAAPTNGQKSGDDYSHGQTVTYTCDTGYTLSGDATLTCELGVWDNAVPTCLPDDCTDPGAAPTNGQKNGDDYSHGQTVTYTCDTGYTLSGDATLTCDLGNWDYAVPTCLPDDCTDPGAAPTNGQKSGDDYSHGQTVTYTCDTGYTLSGDATLTCELGVWDNAVPTCLPDDCTDPGAAPTNGQKSGDDYSHGQTVTYTCDTGYTLSGDGTLTCELGVWDNTVPTCLPDDCTDPGAAPTNGQKNGDDYSHGQTVTYTCDTGYTLSGDATLTCDLGNWDYAVPTCLRKRNS
ncbi:CUB and sushi domain-containing protein 3-like, partial [Ptychodera flava]|uniref:CUB and sushi domain-containing protein 3-like n=1 Tax=Ptychodera flava TaxID=63121 RepID=UPI00396A9556